MDRQDSRWPDKQGKVLHSGDRICEWLLSQNMDGETGLTNNKAAKRYVPDWPGIDKFQGVVHHSSFWPDDEIDVRGKRCAVIGTGASGVQISQEWGPIAGSVKVFQRTPNLAIPMGKRPLTVEEQTNSKQWYHRFFEMRERTFGGFLYNFSEKGTFEDSPEEREKFYQSLFDHGGFVFCKPHPSPFTFACLSCVGVFLDATFCIPSQVINLYQGWRTTRTTSRMPRPTPRRITSGQRQSGVGSVTQESGISWRPSRCRTISASRGPAWSKTTMSSSTGRAWMSLTSPRMGSRSSMRLGSPLRTGRIMSLMSSPLLLAS